ncbi:MAG TPA: 6-pyruvoyl-tetrahydropterin synthase-related protein [Candidatus Acidoferrum sp.]|jgi:hypothetical protein
MSDSPGLLPTVSAEHRKRDWGLAALVSLGTTLAVLAPFFFLGTASGHDVAFHMASWLDAAGQWKQGVILPRWTEWANFGFGEPRFIFYPPLSWLLGGFLGTILPWPAVAAVFIAIVQTFAGLSAYTLTRRLFDSRFAALFGAVCFAANPYSLLIIYVRSDFAELLAIAIFPLLFLAIWRISETTLEKVPGTLANILFFALIFSAIWLSNAPAAVIATYSAALLFTLAALQRHSFSGLLRGGAGMLLGFGLAAFYLIPAIYEQRWVNISGALASGLSPTENFLFAATSDAEHDAFNRIASNLAVLFIVWLLLAAAAAWRLHFAIVAGNRGRQFFSLMAVLGTVAFLFMLPITSVFWRYLPELRFMQFPWRWMSVLAVCAVIFTAASARGWLRWAWPILVLLAVVASAHYLVKHSWWDTEDMPTLQNAIASGVGFEGTDEYDPAGDDHTDLPQKMAQAMLQESTPGVAAKIVVEKWDAERRVVQVVAHQPTHLVLRLVDYPAWRVTVNGNPVSVQHPEGTRQMIVPLPAGDSQVLVEFARTTDRTIGGWISVVSAVGCVWIVVWKRRDPLSATS